MYIYICTHKQTERFQEEGDVLPFDYLEVAPPYSLDRRGAWTDKNPIIPTSSNEVNGFYNFPHPPSLP